MRVDQHTLLEHPTFLELHQGAPVHLVRAPVGQRSLHLRGPSIWYICVEPVNVQLL